jgi:hypothetical protein
VSLSNVRLLMTHYRAQPGGKETSSPNPSPSPSSPSIASKKLASGAIAGIVTGILFLFFALIGAFFCIRRRRAQASTQTAAQPFNVPDDNEREVKESDFYSPPIPPRSQPPGSVAPVLGHQQLATRPDATRYATPNAASSRHFGSSDIPHATMPPVERGLVVPYFDSSAETARRQQTLATGPPFLIIPRTRSHRLSIPPLMPSGAIKPWLLKKSHVVLPRALVLPGRHLDPAQNGCQPSQGLLLVHLWPGTIGKPYSARSGCCKSKSKC